MHNIEDKGRPCSSAGKEFACSAGDLGSIPDLGRSPAEGKGYPGRIPWTGLSMGLQRDTTERLSLSSKINWH